MRRTNPTPSGDPRKALGRGENAPEMLGGQLSPKRVLTAAGLVGLAESCGADSWSILSRDGLSLSLWATAPNLVIVRGWLTGELGEGAGHTSTDKTERWWTWARRGVRVRLMVWPATKAVAS